MSSYKLKLQLFQNKVKERKCEGCGNEFWLGQPIPLELHHVDGNSTNNQAENLKILCPNCHAQTHSFCKKKNNKNTKSFEEIKLAVTSSYNTREVCLKVGLTPKGGNYETVRNYMLRYGLSFLPPKPEAPKENKKHIQKHKNKYATLEEARLANCKVKNRPSKEQLLEMIWKQSLTSIAKKYQVADNAIKKWCQRYNIPCPLVGYWRKLSVGKSEECSIIKSELFKKFGLEEFHFLALEKPARTEVQ